MTLDPLDERSKGASEKYEVRRLSDGSGGGGGGGGGFSRCLHEDICAGQSSDKCFLHAFAVFY